MDNKLFCSLPFDGIFLNTNSDIKSCCSGQTVWGNLKTSKLEDMVHSEAATSIRRAMLNGEVHPNCVNCYQREEAGVDSQRVAHLIESVDPVEFQKLDENYYKLKNLDLRWSNLCNLTCVYCEPIFSSKWAKIRIEDKSSPLITSTVENEESLFKFIEDNRDSNIMHLVIILGGESTLHKQNLRLLDVLPNAKFYVLSNLATDLSKVEVGQRFIQQKNLSWGASFETIGARFEYVRHGASWDLFKKNLEYIKEHSRNNRITAQPVYCIYSAFNLVEYYDFIVECKMIEVVLWQMVGNADGMLVTDLSDPVKRAAIVEIEKVSAKYPNASGIDSLLGVRDNLIKSFENGPADNKMNLKFIKFTEDLESNLLRKTVKFKELWPELYELLAEGQK